MITKKEYEHLKGSLLYIVDSKYGSYRDTCEAVKALVELENYTNNNQEKIRSDDIMIDKIKHKIEQLTHKVEMMKKRQEQLVHEAYTKRHRERDDEMLRLEVKIEEDEKFIKFLKELIGE